MRFCIFVFVVITVLLLSADAAIGNDEEWPKPLPTIAPTYPSPPDEDQAGRETTPPVESEVPWQDVGLLFAVVTVVVVLVAWNSPRWIRR